MIIRGPLAGAAFAAALILSPAMASDAPAVQEAFYTTGTGSGPVPKAKRAQPANVLIAGDQIMMIDVGDGATEQLGKIGVPIQNVQTLFISHLHFDHTGGLFALISRRFQVLTPGALTIYGPPGTRATIDAMLAAMQPAVTAQSNIRARSKVPPEDMVKVVELSDGWTGKIGGVTVTAASNSHYILQPEAPGKKDTYAFRFDTPTRSIVYTGDTGPSAATEILAKGADMLFSEIMDPAAALENLKKSRPDIPPPALAAVEAHYRSQHLSPDEVGKMAARASVRSLVLTHNAIDDAALPAAKAEVAVHYKGPISFAEDLQKF
jgi:ribonuclease BN (tRNA processing enzyme)